MKKSLFMLLLASSLLSGCASIVGSTSETVAFNTNVADAEAEIRNKKNVVVYSGRLPISLSLKKKAGFFFRGRVSYFCSQAGICIAISEFRHRFIRMVLGEYFIWRINRTYKCASISYFKSKRVGKGFGI